MKFSKRIVTVCILAIIAYTAVQTLLSYKLMIELSPTLTTCVYTFFGTELAACACIRIFDREDKKEEDKREKERMKSLRENSKEPEMYIMTESDEIL